MPSSLAPRDSKSRARSCEARGRSHLDSRALDAIQSYLVAARALSGADFSGLASELADAACTLAVEYEDL